MGQGHYRDFWRLHRLSSLPASEIQLAGFITYLADVVKAAPASIKVYSAAVRSLHVEHGYNDPFNGTTLPHRVFTGVKRSIGTHARLVRLPITLPTLRGIVSNVRADHTLLPIDQLMVAAASSLAFFGFLRCGEALAVKRNEISVESGTSRNLKLTIQKSKTDPFRQGCVLFVGSTNAAEAAVCPVRLTETYLNATATRPHASLLFAWQRGAALEKKDFVAAVQRAIQRHGVPNAKAYMGHSFRSGAATSAAAAGVPEWLIKAMGRWTSSAYETYIKTPKSAVTTVSQAVATASRGQD